MSEELKPILYSADGEPIFPSRQREVLLPIACCLATGLIALGMYAHRRHQDPPKMFFEGPLSALSATRGVDARWNLWIDAAHRASQIWEQSGISLPQIKLMAPSDPSACGDKAIACTDIQRKVIYVVEDGSTVDRTTVMLHEIGHAIGIPHITDDPLMNAEYIGPVESIPAEVVAFAKVKLSSGFVIKQ